MKSTQKLAPGNVVTLKVVRKSDLGAFLDAGTGNTGDDILLHKGQQTGDVEIGQELKVFLYTDPKGRLTASMRLPQMREGQVARVTVINTTKDGAFVDIGAERGIFMPHAGRRGNVRPGDKVWVKLYRDKSDRLAVTMEVEDELRRASKPATQVQIGDMVSGSVYNITDEGAFLFTKERYIAFIHKNEMIRRLKVGEEVDARITFIREDGRVNVSMRLQKEDAIHEDADKLLAVLRTREGKMPYSDDTAPEVIKDKFNISKAAFKRAMGKLLKDGIVEQREGWTYLKEKREQG